MKTILCYGDSNTHGYIPETGRRFPFNVRWTGILQQELGNRVMVIEEGLNGRSTVYDDANREGRNGASYLPVILESHLPIDIMTVMLGTNDVYNFKNITAHDAAQGVSRLIELTRATCDSLDYPDPTIVVISPPIVLPLSEEEKSTCIGDPSYSQDFSSHYREVAKTQHCLYLDAAKIVNSSTADGVHLDAGEHKKLGLAVSKCISEIIKR